MFYRLLVTFVCLSSLLMAEAPAPGQPDQIPAPPTYEHALGKMLLTLFGLIVLIFLTLWVIRRLSAGRFSQQMKDSRAIKILEKRALSAKSVLYLVEVGDKRLLLSESQLEVRSHKFIDGTSYGVPRSHKSEEE